MKIVSIIGARPQFIKASPVSRELRKRFSEVLVHTGQHYDKNMSDIFFSELGIPLPDYNLNIGSGSHGQQTGKMLMAIEDVLIIEKPDALLVYGDTNSTLAGALAASKMHIPVLHVEAGLRSYNMLMPEEQNRVLTDHISSILFCPTETAVTNLKKEGIVAGVYNVGDVMYDTVLYNIKISEQKYSLEKCIAGLSVIEGNTMKLFDKGYYLATIHRAENTDDISKLKVILTAFNSLNKPVLFPMHPRLKNLIYATGVKCDNVIFIEPVGYLEMLFLVKNSSKIVTDSGGLQKEAYFLETPCITLRDQTEWVETLEGGWNVLTEIVESKIIQNVNNFFHQTDIVKSNKFGYGNAASNIAVTIDNFFNKNIKN